MDNVSEHVENERPRPLTAEQIKSGDEAVMVEHLLKISLDRLEAGRLLEVERRIVYPETSVILRDVVRLADRLRELQGQKEKDEARMVAVLRCCCPGCLKRIEKEVK